MARRTIMGLDASNKRNGIIAAAVELYSERGIAQTSMRQVAAAVGITDATLYHYFSNKDALVDAAFRSTSFQTEDLERALAEPADSIEERLLAVGRAFFDVLADDPAWTRLVIRESLTPRGPDLGAGMPALLGRLGRRRVALLAGALVQDGGASQQDAELAAAHFFHACVGFWIGEVLVATRPPSRARRAAYLEHVVATIAAGLAVPATKGRGV